MEARESTHETAAGGGYTTDIAHRLRMEMRKAFDVLKLKNLIPHLWELHVTPLQQISLLMDSIFFPLLASMMLFFPFTFLSLHRRLALSMGIAAPSPSVASNILILEVQVGGSLCLAYSLWSISTLVRRDVIMSRYFALSRLVMGMCLLYAAMIGANDITSIKGLGGGRDRSSSHSILILFGIHSVFMGLVGLVGTGGGGLRGIRASFMSMLQRLPEKVEGEWKYLFGGGSSGGSRTSSGTTEEVATD